MGSGIGDSVGGAWENRDVRRLVDWDRVQLAIPADLCERRVDFPLKTKLILVLAIATSAIFLGSSSAAASPATGGFKATVLNKATLAKPTEIDGLGIQFATERPTDVYVQQVDFPGKSSSGWHSHPGLVLVTVKTGSIVFHFGCRTVQFSAGQAFVEPPLAVGMAENVVDAPAQVIAALVVPAGRAPRIDAPAPVCDEDGQHGSD